eukprot:scaffold4448_cov115-Isochrysis_galbana.AAC.2
MVPTERKLSSSTASASLISSSAPASRLVSSSDRSSALVSAYVPEFTSIESSNCTSATGASTTASDCKQLAAFFLTTPSRSRSFRMQLDRFVTAPSPKA